MINIDNYHPVIGLEVHVELKTKSKMFCGCLADYFGKEPNTHVCPICLGLPGVLPVPNKKAIGWCVMLGLALNCNIPLISKFDRKNYFYPDLPKGYQISQYDQPFCVNGRIDIKSQITNHKSQINSKFKIQNSKKIRIRRVHMEEDTGKLIHTTVNGEKVSLIDFNRSGVPLVEIVSEPDFENAEQVKEYLKKLQRIVRYLGVSDADMEKGEMRLEPNISLMVNDEGLRIKEKLPTYKVEVKNINSFRFVEKAINYEIDRQKKILESGKVPVQETRGWDSKKQITVSQRAKEEAMDYRYFPEPDVPPIHWTKSQISNLKSQIPELPDEKRIRLQREYSLSKYDSEILAKEKDIANYFEEAVRINRQLQEKKEEHTGIKTIANWIINKKVDIESVLPTKLIEEIVMASKKTQLDERQLTRIIQEILEKNEKAVLDYKKGKTAVIGFLIGQVKQTIEESADTIQIKKTVEKLLRMT